MHKFFVNANQIQDGKIVIAGEDVNHIKNVLRLSKGEYAEITVKSEPPKTYLTIYDNEATFSILKENVKTKESNISISIFQGIPKSDKMELIIQKCTELGVNEFVPLELKRCIAKIEGDKKIDRWQKIAEAAAKQSGRDIIPKIHTKITIDELCNIIKNYDLTLVAYENETQKQLKDLLKSQNKANKIAIIIGPEGGFEELEIEKLKNSGASIISLGNRILRTETAPIVLTSIIMYQLGDIGGI